MQPTYLPRLPRAERPSGSRATFVAAHSCGAVAASHRLPFRLQPGGYPRSHVLSYGRDAMGVAGARSSAVALPGPVAGVETVVRTVVENVLKGLFGRN